MTMTFSRLVLLTLLAAASPHSAAQGVPDSVEQAAREYRIQVYQRYRLDRPGYDGRRQAGDQLLEAYRRAGAPADQLDGVLQWYQQATHLAVTGETGELPSTPVFQPRPLPAPPAVVETSPGPSQEAPLGEAERIERDQPKAAAPVQPASSSRSGQILKSMSRAILGAAAGS